MIRLGTLPVFFSTLNIALFMRALEIEAAEASICSAFQRLPTVIPYLVPEVASNTPLSPSGSLSLEPCM